jgi:hypothetical protein
VAAIGLLAVLMSACLKLDMNLEVSSDNTVSGTVIFAVQKSLLELSGGSVEDILGSDAPLPSDVPGVSVSEYEDDEFAGQEFTFDAVPLEQFNSEDAEALQIVREGDVFRVTGVLDLSTGLTGATGFTGIDPEQFLQGAVLQIRITFPGEVTDTNGTVDGTTVTWAPEVGERLEIRATASALGDGGDDGGVIGGGGGDDGDSNLVLLLIIGGAVVVAAIVTGVVVSRRRSAAAAAAAAAAGAGAPPMGAAPGPPPSGAPPPPPPPPGPPPGPSGP